MSLVLEFRILGPLEVLEDGEPVADWVEPLGSIFTTSQAVEWGDSYRMS